MKSGDDRRRVLRNAAGGGHDNHGMHMLTSLHGALITAALLATGVMPAAAQTSTDPGGRAALVPAQASTSPPNGLGMRGPQLTVPNVILAEPASEIRLVIELEPADAAPRGSFVRVRGLPPTAALSDGHAIAPGAWAVPTAALKNLRIIVPAGTAGRSEISVTLVTLDGATIAEAKGSLLIAAARLIAPKEVPPPVSAARPSTASAPPPAELPKEQPTSRSFAPFEQAPAAATAPAQPAPPAPPAPPKQEQQAARPPVTPSEPPPSPAISPPVPIPATPKAAPSPPPTAAPKVIEPPAKTPEPAPAAPTKAPEPAPPAPAKELSAAARQKAEGLMSRGRAMLTEGNIAAARLFFERSADEGLAEGALAMGTTFDPVELRSMRALGTQPDPGAARRWYERAKSLGSREADAKLQALPPR